MIWRWLSFDLCWHRGTNSLGVYLCHSEILRAFWLMLLVNSLTIPFFRTRKSLARGFLHELRSNDCHSLYILAPCSLGSLSLSLCIFVKIKRKQTNDKKVHTRLRISAVWSQPQQQQRKKLTTNVLCVESLFEDTRTQNLKLHSESKKKSNLKQQHNRRREGGKKLCMCVL